MFDEDHLDREDRYLLDLGSHPSREEVYKALQDLGAVHMAQHAAELLERVPRDEALRIMNEVWLPQMNAWIHEQLELIMHSLPQHNAPADYAAACLERLRSHIIVH